MSDREYSEGMRPEDAPAPDQFAPQSGMVPTGMPGGIELEVVGSHARLVITPLQLLKSAYQLASGLSELPVSPVTAGMAVPVAMGLSALITQIELEIDGQQKKTGEA